MRVLIALCLVGSIAGAAWMATNALAQPPGGPPGGGFPGGPPGRARERDRGRPIGIQSSVERMMTFDANKDGELIKEEVTDTRLVALFESADADKDGKLTREELTTYLTKEAETLRDNSPAWDGPPGGWPEAGGPGRRGPGGPGGGPGPRPPFGPGMRFGPGFRGPLPIGQIMPEPIQDSLKLSPLQKRRIENLQRNVDRKLSEILTVDQLEQFHEFNHHGPRGMDGIMGPPPGPPRGPGGPEGPGGPRGRRGPPDREGPPGRRPERDEFGPPPRQRPQNGGRGTGAPDEDRRLPEAPLPGKEPEGAGGFPEPKTEETVPN
ncbi:hypothetical protein [Schlesneria sp. DSM 10557]|uniref:hypothetical protein n=1 Tax=Schlesneria sp. DSM 10557 TaxID=3044399 RepID=UPI0035A19392